jgi:TonB family protein
MAAHWIEDDPPERGLRWAVVLSLVTHALALSAALYTRGDRPFDTPELPSWLGYKGKGQGARQLDLLQENALRFRFFQPAVGAGGARGESPRARIEARQQGDLVQAKAQEAASTDGVRAARRAPAVPRSDAAGHADTATPDATGAPALQPDVALSDDLTIIKLVKPTYPARELAAGVSARVWVGIHVAPSGDIDELQVRRAETSPPGSTRAFELTALEALRQWRVRLPAGEQYRNGMWLTVPIEYTPNDADFNNIETVKPEPATSPTL